MGLGVEQGFFGAPQKCIEGCCLLSVNHNSSLKNEYYRNLSWKRWKIINKLIFETNKT